MNTSLPVILFFAANVGYCLAYMVTNIVWLRILTIAAALCTFPYFVFQQQVMYSALFWQSAFALINLFNLGVLYLMRRPVPLTARESLVKNMVFRHFSTREVAALFNQAKWACSSQGQQLVEQEQIMDKLYLLHAGKMQIIQNGLIVAHRGPGSFIGEIAYMTGSASSARVVFEEDSQYLEWDAGQLRLFLSRKHGLRNAFESLLAVNVANKLGTFQQPMAA